RGGEDYGKNDPNWDLPKVTWGIRLSGDSTYYPQFRRWVERNKLEVIFFNEQKDTKILHRLKKDFPQIKSVAYIDYYKENTVKEFYMYDFIICNSKRHYSVFKDHPLSFYVPWGTDPNLFSPLSKANEDELVFFHSAGMSVRKGTELLIE